MKNLNGKVVTVFGGSGFLGKYVVKELAQAGYTVKIVSREPEDSKGTKVSGFVGQVVPVKGNITDFDNLEDMIKGSHAVINLVGILYESGRQRFELLHAQAPEKLAQAAAKLGIEKFVHVSAIVHEESFSKYARSKINGEKAVAAAFPSASIIKPSVVFGAEDNFFNFFAEFSRFSPFLPLIGGGKTKMQPVYVGDVANTILQSVEGDFPGEYELGGAEVLSFKKILKMVLKYTDRKRMLVTQPFGIAKLSSYMLPAWLLTADQVELLKHDNVVSKDAKDLSAFKVKPTLIDDIVPDYLTRHQGAGKPDTKAS